MIEPRVANTIRVNAPISVEDALLHAISRLAMMKGPNDLPAAVMLQDIWAQQGCDHLDTGVSPTGRLVDAISVIVVG